MNPTTLQSRAWEGLCSLLLWEILTVLSGTVHWPVWATVLFPVPSLLVVLDALGPSPLFVRWRVTLGPRGAWRLSAILVGITLAVAWLTLSAPTPRTDQPPVITCAARDLWRGIDPYHTYEPQCLAQLHLASAGATPLAAGPFRNNTRYPTRAQIISALKQDQERGGHAGFPTYGYPPDAPLLIMPVAYAGWFGVSLWVAACSALLLLAIWGRRLTELAPAFAWQMFGLALLWFLYRWNPEDLSYLLLALAFARIDRARLSSLAMAAAVCTNPLSWPCAVVYLAILARLPQRRQRWVWLSGGIALGVLPWMIWDHDLPGQMWSFLNLREFPLGASLGDLARLPANSHLEYFVGLLLGIAVCTFVAWRWPKWRWAMAVVVYGSFVLSWRGLLDYYMPLFWLSPAVALGACRLTAKLGSSPAMGTGPGVAISS